MERLRLTTLQAENANFVPKAIAGYLEKRLGMSVEAVIDVPWQAREERLDAGEIQLGWICGLPYVWKADQPEPTIELLAAPVMAAPRYEGRPVYFSDVVVGAESDFRTFEDLRRATWAYNEPGSHSGYNLTRYQLAKRGEKKGYFGKVVEAGSHQRALEMILRGKVQASAIDSTVLEIELGHRPELAGQIRVIEPWGPSPIPPWVMQRSLPEELKDRLRKAFFEMGEEAEGRAILEAGEMARFAAVEDEDYDPIREMERAAKGVEW